MKKPQHLKCIIDKIEKHQVILRFRRSLFGPYRGQQLIVGRRYLPKDIREGEVISVELLNDQMLTKNRREIAQDILKEILNGE